MKLLPLPLELIQHIVSYDRALSVKKIPKTGPRYNILHTCAPRYQTFYISCDLHGYQVLFTQSCYMMIVMFNLYSGIWCPRAPYQERDMPHSGLRPE